MKTIKKYWKQIAAAVVGLFVLIISIIKISNKTNLKKTNDKLKDNNDTLNKLQGKSERVSEEKKIITQQLVQTKKHVVDLETKKKTVPTKQRTTAQSKQNILNKTVKK